MPFVKRHSRALALGLLAFIIFIAALVFSVGKYSHPVQKMTLLRSARTELTPIQKKRMYKIANGNNYQVKPSYYHYVFSPRRNLLIMQLGDDASHDTQLAHHGSQIHQQQVTQVEMSLINQSRQLSVYDKKLGIEVLSPNRTMLFFAQHGRVGYSTLPTLQPTNN